MHMGKDILLSSLDCRKNEEPTELRDGGQRVSCRARMAVLAGTRTRKWLTIIAKPAGAELQ
jgi:hypothetical protein